MTKAEHGLEDVKFEVRWHGKPHGLLERLLTKIHLNFTDYEITKDELIIKTGFFKQVTNTTELYLLKDPDLTVAKYLGNGKVLEIVRFQVGEGMAKREENFGEEVAKQLGA